MSLLHPAWCIRSFGWLCDWDWVSPVSPSFFSSSPSCQALLEAHLPSFSLANNRCLACLGWNMTNIWQTLWTWNADLGYDSATSARSSHSICQRWKLLAKHGEVLSKFPNTWRIQGKACVLYIYMLYKHQMPWAPRPAKFLGPNLRKKWTLCLWLETWGIYLVNQYVICTQPVLCQYRPILWNGVS